MRLNRIILISLAALSAVACNKNNGDHTPSVTSHINVIASVDTPTRAGYDADNLPGNFYLTVVQDPDDANSEYNYIDVQVTKGEGNTYHAATDLLWKGSPLSDLEVYAYTATGETFIVMKKQHLPGYLEESDLLGASLRHVGGEDITLNDNEVSVKFRHLLCKLDVTFTWDESLDGLDKEVTGVLYRGFGEDVTLNRLTGVAVAGDNTFDIHAYLSASEGNKTYLSEAIFAPQTSDMSLLVNATIGGVEKEYVLNLMPPTGGFVPGNAYTMNVRVSKEVLYLSTAPTLQDWEIGDELVFEKDEPVFTFTAHVDNSETK